jgi:hypothetical protein
VYKLNSFVGFIGDEQVHAQECYVLEDILKIWASGHWTAAFEWAISLICAVR